jgi:glutaredoxin-like protein
LRTSGEEVVVAALGRAPVALRAQVHMPEPALDFWIVGAQAVDARGTFSTCQRSFMISPDLVDRTGQTVPEAVFRYRVGGEWKETSTDELFAHRNVIVFSLPGAFTPTCSSTHLPRFNELAPVFKQHGIDAVVCLSVNDPFVMEEWGKNQEANDVLLLPDGNGVFTQGMGMMVDKSDLNFGRRSWRYSMLVRNKQIEKMFIEPQKPGDPFEVSDADTMLDYLDPQATRPDQVAILSREGCSFCAQAKRTLREAGIDFVDIDLPPNIRSQALGAIAAARTVPQIFINGRLIGGSDELEAYLKA